ncbi:MAG TPA: hypothetical protein VNR63_04665 [Gaiellaceae bacterium]|nr:hypothetical protein [Gaiellaceae bacterium]
MAGDKTPKLRTPGTAGEVGTSDAEPLSSGMAVNAMAELVVDLLSATGLVPEDKLAMVRGRAGQGSLAQAIVDEGVAPPEGIARSLAVRYQVALVDLALTGIDKEAAEQIPLHVLERVAAIPYALENGTLRIAVADPGNLHGIDELRLATRSVPLSRAYGIATSRSSTCSAISPLASSDTPVSARSTSGIW